MGWFYGMLLLSAKCPRPPGKLLMKGDSEKPFEGPVISFLGHWSIIVGFLHETSQGSTTMARKFYLECSSDVR